MCSALVVVDSGPKPSLKVREWLDELENKKDLEGFMKSKVPTFFNSLTKAAKSALYAKGAKRGKAMNRVAAKKRKTAGRVAAKKRVKRNGTSRKPRKTPRKRSAKKASSMKSKRRRT